MDGLLQTQPSLSCISVKYAIFRDMNIHEQRDYYRERVMEDERCHETDQISKEVF